MLVMVLPAVACGWSCESTGRTEDPGPDRHAPADVAPTAEAPQGAAPGAPVTPASRRLPFNEGVDDGARLLAQRLFDAIVSAAPNDVGPRRISLDGLTNRSSAGSEEFDAFRTRFAALLDEALTGSGLSAVPFGAGDYTLFGAVFLDNLKGFDAWDARLSLVSAADRRTLWTADGRVLVLRQPPPAGVQVIPPRAWLTGQESMALWRFTE